MSRAKHDVPGGRWAWFTPQRLVVIALMLGLLLRFLCLGSKSIWLDEVLSVRAARAELGAFASGSVERYHPPLFFLILKGFMRLGTDEALLRLPAAIGGSAAVLLIYVLSRSLFDMATAVSATWFAALAPLLVWYSQEVRGYSLIVMWALLALVALAHLALQRGAGWWLVYVAATTAGLYTHYTFVLVLLVQLLMVVGLLAAGRGTRAAPLYLAAGWLAAAVLYVPWLRTPAAGAFIDRLTSASLYYNALTAGRPELLQNVSGAALAWFLIGGGLMALGLGTWLYHRLLRRRRAWLVQVRSSPIVRGLFIGLFVLVLVVSVLPRGYTMKRYVHVLWFLVPLGFGWLWPWQPGNERLLRVLFVLSLAASLVNVLVIPKEQWREAVDLILAQRGHADVVVLEPAYMSMPFDFYSQGRLDAVGLASHEDVGAKMAEVEQGRERIWLVHHLADVNPAHVAGIQQWLAENAILIQSSRLYRLQLDLYTID